MGEKMNIATIDSKQQTMNSREMADLTEKRHDNVRRTIEALFAEGAISKPQIEDGNKAANGVVERVYHVCKRDSYVIVAQLSPTFTARLVDRWQELENNAAKVITQELTRIEILEMALLSERENIKLRAELGVAAPKVEFVDRYVESSSGSKGFRQVCKLLAANESEFRVFLHDTGIMYKLGGEWVPFAQHLDAGRFEVKAGTSDVSGHAYSTAKFTAKGVQWVAGEWAKFKVAQSQLVDGEP